MYTLILIAMCLVVAGCRSSKNAVATATVTTDSVEVSTHSSLTFHSDSSLRTLLLCFDSLLVEVVRQDSLRAPEQKIRLKAYGAHMASASHTGSSDSALSLSSDSTSARSEEVHDCSEQKQTTAIAEPPGQWIAIVITILVAGGIAYALSRIQR